MCGGRNDSLRAYSVRGMEEGRVNLLEGVESSGEVYLKVQI